MCRMVRWSGSRGRRRRREGGGMMAGPWWVVDVWWELSWAGIKLVYGGGGGWKREVG